MQLKSINPSNYAVLGEVTFSIPEEIKEKFLSAKSAQKAWASMGLQKRVEMLRAAMAEIKERKSEYVLLQSQEMGMPIGESRGGFDGDLDYANWYFDNAVKYLSPETTFENDHEIHQVFYEPLGVAAVILPWNFPLANFIWGAMQSLIAGNVVVLKHSEECSLCGKFIEDVFSKHLPQGVLTEIYGDGEAGKLLLQEDVQLVSFTGSTKTGKYVYEQAGKKFIRAVVELGGSAPGIIFEDADVGAAIATACANRLFNQGQCCDGLKRLIVHESVYDEVVRKSVEIFSRKKIGPADNEDTEVGPLVAKRQLDLLEAQVRDAKVKGARVETGGNSLEEKLGGAFFEPTILTRVTPDMRVWNEEVFGPVLPIVTFKTEEEAVELANQTSFGLGAYVFTEDTERALRVSKSIESGMVSINGANYVMPFNPFGGYKNSGVGREHGKYGFHEVVQIKVIARNR